MVVEAHAVDQGPVRREPEEPRLRVADLPLAGERAHLDEAEAEGAERLEGDRVLVEARREPDRRREAQAERLDLERRIVGEAAGAERVEGAGRGLEGAEPGEGQVVGALGVEAREQGPGEAPVEHRRCSTTFVRGFDALLP